MIKDTSSSPRQQIEAETKLLYDYWHRCASTQHPLALIAEFKSLLVQGRIANAQVSKALEKIIFTASESEFAQILSHCFYLILDGWVAIEGALSHIQELMDILETVNQASSYDRRRKQLIQVIKAYQQTSAYCQLQAIVSIIDLEAISTSSSQAVVAQTISSGGEKLSLTNINQYLSRYTFLYSYFIPQARELERLNKYVINLQQLRQQKLEVQLSKHLIYRFRLKQVAKMKLMSRGAGKVITKVDNPILLSPRAFKTALHQYLSKTDDGRTMLERSQRFIVDNDSRNSYQVFKQDLQRFLLHNIKPRNSEELFHSLAAKLEHTFPQSDPKSLNSTLILQTCRQLYSFLIVNNATSKNSQQFASLIANLGTAQVMIILIRIVLICPESKPDLERKIASIVALHQLDPIHSVPWLFKSLEHLTMAFGIYFGNLDVPVPSFTSK